MRALSVAVFSAALLALAACGGSSPPLPTAAQLARKIPGAHACLTQTPDVLAEADVSCALSGTDSVDVVTFPSMGNEQKWITGQGSWYECCVEGHLFAATYSSASGDDFPLITKALGGRVVTG
jgi:hypothetical protein